MVKNFNLQIFTENSSVDGLTVNPINLLRDNLQNRYQNGFPILKELIQNADDAKARKFIFGKHCGFSDSRHPLLQSHGLWFFNNGEFKESDAKGIKSFGIGSKAGQLNTIGKFGLGLKSVFHLCEAFFYVAWDGNDYFKGGVNPWKEAELHNDWNEIDDKDWNCLKQIGEQLNGKSSKNCAWFLLWLPLRMNAHLRTPSGEKTGSIVNRFPGDKPSTDLDFLNDRVLAYKMAEILPLLRNLEWVEQKNEKNHFVVRFSGYQRLLDNPVLKMAHGDIQLSSAHQPLKFTGLRDESKDDLFLKLKELSAWPKTQIYDELGNESEVPDKNSPEAAVIICSSRNIESSSRLHWSVFLPLEDICCCEDLETNSSNHSFTLLLHGQFFLDSGRNKIRHFEDLNESPMSIDCRTLDEELIRKTWNQLLAQNVLLPLVLPTLEEHCKHQKLSDNICNSLTTTISQSEFFKNSRKYICQDNSWLRTLSYGSNYDYPQWCWQLINKEKNHLLRPIPSPPESDLFRPWRIFPKLRNDNLILYDILAPSLSQGEFVWQELELVDLLSQINDLFRDQGFLDYLCKFLDSCKEQCRNSKSVQNRLIVMIRNELLDLECDSLHQVLTKRQVLTKSIQIISFIQPENKLVLADELPKSVLDQLLNINASDDFLLIPKELDGKELHEQDVRITVQNWDIVAEYLSVLADSFDSETEVQTQITKVIDGLLFTVIEEANLQGFLKKYPTCRAIKVREAHSSKDKLVNMKYLNRFRNSGTLFQFTGGLGSDALGLTPTLAKVLPDYKVMLISKNEYTKKIHNTVEDLPKANDSVGCLAAVGQYTGQLGGFDERQAMLKQATDAGTDDNALCGLRYLLHGSSAYRMDCDSTLWYKFDSWQHPAWPKLWKGLNPSKEWSLIPDELINELPQSQLVRTRIKAINEKTLIEHLQEMYDTGKSPPNLAKLSVEERDEILSCIENEDLWKWLPLHTTVKGNCVSIKKKVYLASHNLNSKDPLVDEVTLIKQSTNKKLSAKQTEWLPPFNGNAKLDAALTPICRPPQCYWAHIMDELINLDKITSEILDLVKNTAWLPTIYMVSVKPAHVFDIQGKFHDDVSRLVSEHRAVKKVQGEEPCFAVSKDIDSKVQKHNAWEIVRKLFLSNAQLQEKVFLNRLKDLLKDLPNYYIGNIKEQPSENKIKIMTRFDDLPGWRQLQMVSNENPDRAWEELKPSLMNSISFGKLIGVLDFLSCKDTQWKDRKSLHDDYLEQLVKEHSSQVRGCLSQLSLASKANSWCKSKNLCTSAHTHGIESKHLLDQEQDIIFGDHIYRGRTNNKVETPTDKISDEEFMRYLKSVTDDLRCYFRAWESTLVPKPSIGGLLSLLDSSTIVLAKEYLYPHSFDWFVKQVQREWITSGNDMLGGRMTVKEALQSIKVGVKINEENIVKVTNILGERIQLYISQKPDTIIAGELIWSDKLAIIPLRKFDPSQLSADILHEILCYSAESLCSDLHGQQEVNLNGLWKALNESNQLEIETARRLILKNIPFYLQQFTINNKKLRKHLDAIERLELHITETETAKKNGQYIKVLEDSLRTKLEELAECIDKKPKVQMAVLQAVKNKLNEYQYDLPSIPMELFQNADDATLELNQHSTHEKTAKARFVVQERGDGIAFAHWGRPINTKPIGFSSDDRRYYQDLKYMLILSASSKTGGQGVTGKFGLGFKSVLLACEEPMILSGRLAVRVVAGMLPQPLKNKIANKQMRRLNNLSGNIKLPGTLINLTNINNKQQDILKQFEQLAGILCVFGKAIKTIEIHNLTSKVVSEWKPEQICKNLEVGNLDIEINSGKHTKALCARSKCGSLLIGIGPKGYRPLPDFVPALWVTTPTQESSHVGFAVNGEFELDVGRGRLAGAAHDNVNIKTAERIGNQAGKALGYLLKLSRVNWKTFQSKLGLEADLEELDFWESIWVGLTEKSLTKEVNDLSRVAVQKALAKLCEFDQAIPNGLSGPLRTFSSLNDIQFQLHKLLLNDDTCRELSTWGRFTRLYSGKNIVSEKTANILKNTNNLNLQRLEMSKIIYLLESNRVMPKDAQVLGRLYLMTKDDGYWEFADTTDLLKKLQFMSEASNWVSSNNLLMREITSNPYDEELLRHKIAPPDRRLHRNYYKVATMDEKSPANEFFRFCRKRMETPVEDLANWVLNADTNKEQLNALIYIAEGEHGTRVAESVRNRKWLKDLITPENIPFQTELDESQQERIYRLLSRYSKPEDGPTPPPDLKTALQRLYKWWLENERSELTNYRNLIYPEGSLIGSEKNKSWWFMLFALGSFQGIGHTKEEQHRNFIRYCQDKGWWNIFTKHDPTKEPDKWMNVIEKFIIEDENEEWTLWIGQFPKLYRLRHWLDDYIDLFQSMSRIKKKISADLLLAPLDNPSLQGDGIDAPSLKRTLKVGYPFVVRELLYHKLINETPFTLPHAYAPIQRIKDFFEEFGPIISTSPELYEILECHLGTEKATFNGSYDIPLRIITLETHSDYHQQLFGRVITQKSH